MEKGGIERDGDGGRARERDGGRELGEIKMEERE